MLAALVLALPLNLTPVLAAMTLALPLRMQMNTAHAFGVDRSEQLCKLSRQTF